MYLYKKLEHFEENQTRKSSIKKKKRKKGEECKKEN